MMIIICNHHPEWTLLNELLWLRDLRQVIGRSGKCRIKIIIIVFIIIIIIIIAGELSATSSQERSCRDYQETLHQSQEQMEGAQAILDSSQVLIVMMMMVWMMMMIMGMKMEGAHP